MRRHFLESISARKKRTMTTTDQTTPASVEVVSISVELFKFAVIDEGLSDADILQLFLYVVVESEEDIFEVVGVLQRHRLEVIQQLKPKIAKLAQERAT